jgi:hypothetical protein
MVGPMTAEDAVQLMLKYKVRRLKTDGLEVELDPQAFTTEARAIESISNYLGSCPCGHAVEEHNEAGCLRGCAEEKCLEPQPKPSTSWTATLP